MEEYEDGENECDHDFYRDDDWKSKVYFDGFCLRVPITCDRCKLEAEESWTEWLYTDKYTGEVL